MSSSSASTSFGYRFVKALGRRVRLGYQKAVGFRRDFARFQQLTQAASGSASARFPLDWCQRYPCLGEATALTSFDPHYIYHPAWAARQLAADPPAKHIDISSSLTFCSIVSAFIPVDFYDYRPAPLKMSGLQCRSADLTALEFEDGSIAFLHARR